MRDQRIKEALSVLEPLVLEIQNESHMHSGPRADSHFKVLIVSSSFQGINRVARQREVNALLESEFSGGMHALSLRCLAPDEAEALGMQFKSPDCASSGLPTDS